MRYLGFLCVVLSLALQVQAQGITGEDAFTAMAAERVAKELPDYNVRPAGRLTLGGKRADGESIGELSLDRLWSFCQRNSQQCGPAMEEFAGGIGEAIRERDRPIDGGMIRLAVRPEAYVDQLRRQLGAKQSGVYAKPVVPGLMMVAVLDSARSMRFVNEGDLKKLSMDEVELFQRGRSNLVATSKPLSEVAPVPVPGSIGRIAGEDYASSRIIFHEEWRDMSVKLNGRLIVMLPAPNVLLYGDGSTPMGVEALRTLAMNVARQSSRPLSPAVLLWTEGGWEVFK